MIIAGFDPGSSIFGIGIIKILNNNPDYIFSSEIRLRGSDFNEKMKYLLSELDRIYIDYTPEETAIEEGFLGKNVRSMNILSKIRGVVLAQSLINGKNLTFYSPREIKTSVTGNGNASKEQVNKMIKYIFGLKNRKIGFDESDALATAYCHYSLAEKRS